MGVGLALPTEWYKEFFRGVALDFWSAAATEEQTRAEVDFLERALRLAPSASVLDVPCGLGRHSIELARRGASVTGVDYSAEATGRAQVRAAELGVEVDWRTSDMRNLPWTSEFDGALCFGNSFGYLDADGMRAFLESIARALRPDARFVFDTGMTAESILPHLREREWLEIGDVMFLEENRYHAAEGCLETHYTFVRGGVTERRVGLHFIFTVREICAMLEVAGFRVEGLLGGISGAPFALGGRYLIVVAQKR
jgi:SAM-dependent methyltransferase